MPEPAWKKFEREAAVLMGGKRHWANSGERLDFESDTTIGQCKLVKVLSLEALTQLAEEMAREALPKQKAGVVVVKVRRGRGRPSPMLVVCTAPVWEALNGRAQAGGTAQRRRSLSDEPQEER
jgi:hypothetical protein